MLNHLPEVIIKNCDQPPFFTLLLDLASREPERLAEWSCAFSEAGLRSPAVANSFVASSVRLWTAQAQLVDRDHRWFKYGMIERTPYTECVSVACSRNETSGSFPLISALSGIRAPGNDPSTLSVICINLAFVLLVPMFLTFIRFSYSVDPIHVHLQVWSLTGALLVLEMVSIGSVLVMYGRRAIYLNILSLPSITKSFFQRFGMSISGVHLSQRPSPLLLMGRRQAAHISQYNYNRQQFTGRTTSDVT